MCTYRYRGSDMSVKLACHRSIVVSIMHSCALVWITLCAQTEQEVWKCCLSCSFLLVVRFVCLLFQLIDSFTIIGDYGYFIMSGLKFGNAISLFCGWLEGYWRHSRRSSCGADLLDSWHSMQGALGIVWMQAGRISPDMPSVSSHSSRWWFLHYNPTFNF